MATYKHKLKKYFLKSYFLPCKGKSLPVSFFATGVKIMVAKVKF